MAESLPPIVDVAWLVAHRAEVFLADVRWYLDGRSGRAAYEAGHVPGAHFVDLDADLSAKAKGGRGGRHPLPEPDAFAAAMGRAGIGDDTTVVAYDDSGGGTAGRLVWMLRVLGRKAALLDGGLASTGEREVGPSPTTVPESFTARPWPASAVATADELAAHVAAGGVALDARSAERFRGENEVVDPRAGHIPGATSAPWTAALDGNGRFRSAVDLRDHFAALGARPDAAVVCYCGSGVSACADVLAAEAAGLPRPRLFVASWSGWSADPERPVAIGHAEPS